MACSRSRSSWPSRACAGRADGRGRAIAEHAHDLVPERGGRELETVVVDRAAHEHELLVHARERRREQEAVALLLARALPRQAGRRERSPQLGRAGGLGRLAARQHARLEAAQRRPRGRERAAPGRCGRCARAPRQTVAEAHLHRVERGQHVIAVGAGQRARTARRRLPMQPRARAARRSPVRVSATARRAAVGARERGIGHARSAAAGSSAARSAVSSGTGRGGSDASSSRSARAASPMLRSRSSRLGVVRARRHPSSSPPGAATRRGRRDHRPTRPRGRGCAARDRQAGS